MTNSNPPSAEQIEKAARDQKAADDAGEATALPTPEEVRAFLESLGNTADEVYESLKAREVRGVWGIANDCPIAVLLNQQFPIKDGGWWTWPTRVQPGPYSTSVPFAVQLPEPVLKFIKAFDANHTAFPDVDRPL